MTGRIDLASPFGNVLISPIGDREPCQSRPVVVAVLKVQHLVLIELVERQVAHGMITAAVLLPDERESSILRSFVRFHHIEALHIQLSEVRPRMAGSPYGDAESSDGNRAHDCVTAHEPELPFERVIHEANLGQDVRSLYA